jgi:hypothetical protein
MPQSSRRTFRILVSILAVITVIILGFIGVVLAMNLPPSPTEIAATLAALPNPTSTAVPSPTPVPTLPGVTEALLVCQREASQAMVARSMVGAVNLSENHLFLLKWVSRDWQVEDLNDALAGVIMGFDVALDVWDQGCAVYDRVQIDVYDQRGDRQEHRFSVQAQMDDLLKWKAGGLSDSGLIARLEIARDTGQ